MSTTELDHDDISTRLRLAVAQSTDQPAALYGVHSRSSGIELVPQPGLNWMLENLIGEGASLPDALDVMAEWEYRCPLDHSAVGHSGLAGLALRCRGIGVSVDAPPEYAAFLAVAHAAGADLTGMPGTMRVHTGMAVCADGTVHHALWIEDEPGPRWAVEKPGDEPFNTGPVRESLERFWAATIHTGEPEPS